MTTTPTTLPRLSSTFEVGGYTCELSFTNGQLTAARTPTVPPNLSRKETQQYRRGRDALMAEVAASIGGGVLVVEA